MIQDHTCFLFYFISDWFSFELTKENITIPCTILVCVFWKQDLMSVLVKARYANILGCYKYDGLGMLQIWWSLKIYHPLKIKNCILVLLWIMHVFIKVQTTGF